MKLLMENWNRFQLCEGTLEKETTEISREIVNQFKKRTNAGTFHGFAGPHWIQVRIPDALDGLEPEDLADIDALMVRIMVPDKPPSQDKTVAIRGQFAKRKKELRILMTVDKERAPTPEDLIKTINDWLPDLKNILRHEIEHTRQTRKGDQGKEQYDWKGMGLGGTGDRQSALEYFQSEEEKEAYVTGIYKKAKMTKKPFGDLLRSWLNEMSFSIMDMDKGRDEVPDREVAKVFREIETDYLAYAKKRFPAAQGIEESWQGFLFEQKGEMDSSLVIRESPIHGLGVFAAEDIPAHTDLGAAQIAEPLGDYQITKLGKHHNHSSQPTCYNKMAAGTRNLYPNTDLRAGDEITVDYTMQPELEQPELGWE